MADKFYAQQPSILTSIPVLSRMGVGMAQLELVLHILLFAFPAMQLSSHQWPTITEDNEGGCL